VIALPLEGDLHHPQGLSPRASGRDDGWWVTTVDPHAARGVVVGFDAAGRRTHEIEVTDGDLIHPGGCGLDADGLLWVPVAEYRPASTTRVLTIAPDGTATSRFEFGDHLGLIVPRPDGLLVAGTWGSRTLLLLERDGTIVARVDNPQHVVDYQDATARADGTIIATGTGRGFGRDLGGLAVLDADLGLRLLLPMPDRSPGDRPVTYNATWCEPTASGCALWAVPDDGAAALLRLDLPI
jgi:hypothetical protein